jgi:hypothetical protein
MSVATGKLAKLPRNATSFTSSRQLADEEIAPPNECDKQSLSRPSSSKNDYDELPRRRRFARSALLSVVSSVRFR